MTSKTAEAFPKKHFFLEMFTRDISLEDCILDLIDNSIDALIRTRRLDISATILNKRASSRNGGLPAIRISYSEEQFSITDHCGGIPLDLAITDVFTFGHSAGSFGGQLGAYGVGLKRALFKIGTAFAIRSATPKDGFAVELNIDEWAQKDNTMEDWRIPITTANKAPSISQAGTHIRITQLRKEVKMILNDGAFAQRLHSVVAQGYALFLKRYVRLFINADEVLPEYIPIAQSNEVRPGKEVYQDDGVDVTLMASIASRHPEQGWVGENAGWYILCNGRVVVPADQTNLTGWGDILPSFHTSKYRGFVGIAFFHSKDPLKLPWTTTKRGINRESRVFQLARKRMALVSRPIITFLNKMYPSDVHAEAQERDIAGKVTAVDVRDVYAKKAGPFEVKPKKMQKEKTSVKIQFDAKIADVARAKKCLRQPNWGARKIGEYTFQYFLDNECPE